MTGGVAPYGEDEDWKADIAGRAAARELGRLLADHTGVSPPENHVPRSDTTSASAFVWKIDTRMFVLGLYTLLLPPSAETLPVRFEIGPARSRISVRSGSTCFWVELPGQPSSSPTAFEAEYGPLMRLARLYEREGGPKHLRLEFEASQESLRILSDDFALPRSRRSGGSRPESYVGLQCRKVDLTPHTSAPALNKAVPRAALLRRVLGLSLMFTGMDGREGPPKIVLENGRATAGFLRGACLIDAPKLSGLRFTIDRVTGKQLARALHRMIPGSVNWSDFGDRQEVRNDTCGFSFAVLGHSPPPFDNLLKRIPILEVESDREAMINPLYALSVADLGKDGASFSFRDGHLIAHLENHRNKGDISSSPPIVRTALDPAGPVEGPHLSLQDLITSLEAVLPHQKVKFGWTADNGRVSGARIEAQGQDHLFRAFLPAKSRP